MRKRVLSLLLALALACALLPTAALAAKEDFVIDENGMLIEYNGPGGDVVVPEGVTAIQEPYQSAEWNWTPGPFQGNATITSITLPDSLLEIRQHMYFSYGRGPFGGCTNLKSIVFGNGLKTLPDLNRLPALEHVTLPSHLTTIPEKCFYDCPKLTSITIPSGVTSIENFAFDESGITSLVIPEGVKACGKIAGSNFRELTLPSTLEKRPELACPELRKLTLPTDGWAFKGISRADFMQYIRKCPKLGEIVNCPNEFMDDLIAPNLAIQKNWKDPQSTIVAQSARITSLSDEITAGLATDYDKAKAISQWVVDHIKYDGDYYYAGLKDYSDVPFDPEEILDKGQAVCAGIARLTQALMVAQKIPCLYVLGYTGSAHAWNLAYIDGEYLWIDNTAGMDYFGLGIYAISRDHTATGAASFNNVKGPGTLVSDITETPVPSKEPQPDKTPAPTDPTAYASTQTVLVDGKPVTFNAYALKDANGNDTNYVKLRDVADVLNGTSAQFQVGWDGSIAITTSAAYTPNGTEMVQNFTGNQSYTVSTSPVTVNGVATNLEAITLTDASGGGYTYFKLRDLGAALGFNVSWSAQTGITIDSGASSQAASQTTSSAEKPYDITIGDTPSTRLYRKGDTFYSDLLVTNMGETEVYNIVLPYFEVACRVGKMDPVSTIAYIPHPVLLEGLVLPPRSEATYTITFEPEHIVNKALADKYVRSGGGIVNVYHRDMYDVTCDYRVVGPTR